LIVHLEYWDLQNWIACVKYSLVEKSRSERVQDHRPED